MEKMTGILYGIGVGPGDPDLITMKAVKLLKTVDVIFTASSTKNDFSLAMEIAQPYLPDSVEVQSLSFPMTTDKSVANRAWEQNAAVIAEQVKAGKRVAFLTLGDPLTYSTFGYVLQKIQKLHTEVPVQTVPGITSYQAAASRINRVLVEAEESLLLTSGAFGGENVRKVNGSVENVVLLKAYKNVGDITDALDEAGMINNSAAVSKCGREGEAITHDIRGLSSKDPDYWTLILAKKAE